MVAIIKDDDSYRHKRERTKKKYFTQNTFVVLLPKEEKKTKNTEMCAKVSFFVVELFSHTFFFVYLTYICTYTRT